MADDLPEDLFTFFYKRAFSDADRDRLKTIKAGLGLSGRDELWPLIITLDHYTRTNITARDEQRQETRRVLAALKAIPEDAGPIAHAQAAKAVEKAVDRAATEIARVSVSRSQQRADRISKRQFIVAGIVGAVVATAFAGLGAVAMWAYLKSGVGICMQPPGPTADGGFACYVARLNIF